MKKPEIEIVIKSVLSSQESLEAAFWTAEAWPYSISRLVGEYMDKLSGQILDEWGHDQWVLEKNDFSEELSWERSRCELSFRKKAWKSGYSLVFESSKKHFDRPDWTIRKPRQEPLNISARVREILKEINSTKGYQDWAWWHYLEREISGMDSLSNLVFLKEASQYIEGKASIADLQVTNRIFYVLSNIKDRLDADGVCDDR